MKTYYHVNNLNKKDRHAVQFMDWMLACGLTSLEEEYLKGYEDMTAMERMQAEERMQALADVWDWYTVERDAYIKTLIDGRDSKGNIESYELETLPEDWHEVLEESE